LAGISLRMQCLCWSGDEADLSRRPEEWVQTVAGMHACVRTGAMLFNPWHADHAAQVLLSALSMSAQERKIRFDAMLMHVREHTARIWLLRLCTDLQQITPPSQKLTHILPAFKAQAGAVYSALNSASLVSRQNPWSPRSAEETNELAQLTNARPAATDVLSASSSSTTTPPTPSRQSQVASGA
jgi:hypothetical protein